MPAETSKPHIQSLPPLYEAGFKPKTMTASEIAVRRPSMDSPTEMGSFLSSFPAADKVGSGYDFAFSNWQRYSMNREISNTYQPPRTMPSPPSTLSSTSTRSSITSWPAEVGIRNTDATAASRPTIRKPRSRSLAIPNPTTCCPSCGLRRPSLVSDQAISPTTPSSNPGSPLHTRSHLPLHLHCPEPCPDEIMPTQVVNSPISPYGNHSRRRRRSSLCYAESLTGDSDISHGSSVLVGSKDGQSQPLDSTARDSILQKPNFDIGQILEGSAVDD